MVESKWVSGGSARSVLVAGQARAICAGGGAGVGGWGCRREPFFTGGDEVVGVQGPDVVGHRVHPVAHLDRAPPPSGINIRHQQMAADRPMQAWTDM